VALRIGVVRWLHGVNNAGCCATRRSYGDTPPQGWEEGLVRPIVVRLLPLVAVVLAGVGQFLLMEGNDAGWLVYLTAGVVLLGASLPGRDPAGVAESDGLRPPPRGIWPALALLGQLAAFQLARADHDWPAVLPWALSLVAAVASVTGVPFRVAVPPLSARLMYGLALGGILIFATLARFIDLDGLPGGVHGDEGEFGMVAVEIARGEGPSPFGVAFLDDPALYTHLLAPFVALLGPNMTAIRLLSAIAGTISIGLFFLFVRDLGGNRAALIAALLLAGSAVHINYSRLALNVVEAPLFAFLALWLLWKGMTTERPAWYLLAGIAGGVAWYFHFSARIIAPVLGLALLWHWAARRLGPGRALRDIALTATGGLLSLSPLFAFSLTNTGQLTNHVNSRLVWNLWPETAAAFQTTPDDWFGILRGQTYATLAALIQRPDEHGFFDFAQTPLLSVIIAPLAVLGLVALCARPREPRAIVLLSGFAVPFICGGVLVSPAGASHRLLLLLPPALVAAALLLDRLIGEMPPALPRWAGPGVASLLLLLPPVAVFHGTQAYFAAAAHPWAPHSSQARQLGALEPGTVAYVVAAPHIYADHGPSRYLGQPIERRDLYNPTAALPADTGGRGLALLFNPAYRGWVPLARAYYPQAQVTETRLPNGDVVLTTLVVPPGATASPPATGLRGEIRPPGGAPVQARYDPALAFIRLHELAGGKDYEARWEGRLRPPQGGRYTLEVVTDGAVTVRLDGVPVIAEPGMARDPRAIEGGFDLGPREYRFEIAGTWRDNDGHLALYWRKDGGERELVPPSAFLAAPDIGTGQATGNTDRP
jgi:4-amino-4-deoxy-L-arabinose transferase-like glycosyltransferase